jgi:hypothetical protein
MRRVEIAGSYYELGLEYGRIVSENKLDWWWTPPSAAKLALVKACERQIAVHAPGGRVRSCHHALRNCFGRAGHIFILHSAARAWRRMPTGSSLYSPRTSVTQSAPGSGSNLRSSFLTSSA